MWYQNLSAVCIWLQEAMKILNRFGYKKVTDDFLVMAENFRPENCFVILVRICQTFLIQIGYFFYELCKKQNRSYWNVVLAKNA